MLTLIQVRQNFMVDSVTISCWRCLIIYSGIFLTAFALLYSLFRLFAYGALANVIIFVKWTVTTDPTSQPATSQLVSELVNLVERENKNIVGIIHPKYFLHYRKWGFALCIGLAFVTMLLVYALIN